MAATRGRALSAAAVWLVLGAGQQLAGLLGDRFADLAHQGPNPRDLGVEPVIVVAQPVVVGLKLRYVLGERLQRGDRKSVV